jgi:hypothetical protein
VKQQLQENVIKALLSIIHCHLNKGDLTPDQKNQLDAAQAMVDPSFK